MAVFSEAEFKEFDQTMKQSAKDAQNGKKPSISSVLLSLQFATTMPNEKGKFWFEDEVTATLVLLSVRKLMDENTPDMFSVGEKAYMFSVLNTGKILIAIREAGFDIGGVWKDSNGNTIKDDANDTPNPDEEGEEWKKGGSD
jgi:hypothetical protein